MEFEPIPQASDFACCKKLIQGVTFSSWKSERSISGLVVEYIAIDVTRDDSHPLLTDTAPAKVQAIGLVIHWILFGERPVS